MVYLLVCPEMINFNLTDGRLLLGVFPLGCTAKLPRIFIFEPPHFQEGVPRVIRLLSVISVCSRIFRAIALLLEMGRLHLALAIVVILLDLLLEVGF